MTIQNESGRTGYSRTMARGYEGSPAYSSLKGARAVRNPDLAQISTVTVGGTAADGVYSFDVEDPISGVTTTVSQTRATTPATNTDLAAAFVLLVNANAALLNVCTASNAAGVVTLAFLHSGIDYTVDNGVAPGGASVTPATTQSAGGSAVPFGRFCTMGAAEDGQASIALPTASTLAAAIRGVSLRPEGQFANAGSALASASDSIPVGTMGTLAYDGAMLMKNVGSVAAAPGGRVHCVVDSSNGFAAGAASAEALTGVAKVVTGTPTAVNDTWYQLTINFDDGSDFVFEVLSDASATATEICDDFRAAMAADPGFTAKAVATGTATLILTGEVAGQNFEVINSGVGAWASITDTTEASADTVALDAKDFYWVEDTAASAIGPVMLRC